MNRIAKLLPGENIYSGSNNPLAALLTNSTELARAKGKLDEAYPLIARTGDMIYADVDTAYFDLVKPRIRDWNNPKPITDAMAKLILNKWQSNNYNQRLYDLFSQSVDTERFDGNILADYLSQMEHIVVGDKFWESPTAKNPEGQNQFINALVKAFRGQDIESTVSVSDNSHNIIVGVLATHPDHPLNKNKFVKNPLMDKEMAKAMQRVAGTAYFNDLASEKPYVIFGDNYLEKGNAGQAIIRGIDKAFGIPTKRLPSTTPDSYVTDENLDEYISKLQPKIDFLKRRFDDSEQAIFPSTGIGTGLAVDKYGRSQNKAAEYLATQLSDLGVPKKYIGKPFGVDLGAGGSAPMINRIANPVVDVESTQPIQQQVVETNIEQPNRVAVPVSQPSRSYTLTHHPVTPDTYPKRRKKD